MKLLVSACLLGTNCKYSGGNNRNAALVEFLKDHTVIPVCPEVMGGLPIPRSPAEIVDGIVTNAEGIRVDAEFRAGAAEALRIALTEHVDAAILQSRSPSCGVKEIYDGSFQHRRISGQGVFAAMLAEARIPAIDLEDWQSWAAQHK